MQLSVNRFTLALALAFVVLAADQAAKLLIVEFVMQPPREIPLLPFLNLVLGYNPGISFGLFADQIGSMPTAFGALKAAIVLALLMWAGITKSFVETAALGCIAGGAAGNIIDRFRDGAVTDFIDVYVGTWHWPTFNTADIAIVLGASALVLHSLRPASKSAGGIA